MENVEIYAPLIFILGSLLVGAILKVYLRKINIPYTVALFIIGIILGTLNHGGYFGHNELLNATLSTTKELDPDLILNLFLPILIFSAAYDMDTHLFKKVLLNSTILAVPGMVVAMALTAALMMLVSTFAPAYSCWNWSYALMFGALVSATDPVAVVALLKELGVSKRFSTLIDGESLLNDGTGIVLFMICFTPLAAAGGSSEQQRPFMDFMVVVFGGLLVGYLVAQLYLLVARSKVVTSDTLLQSSVMILLAYLTFILAQDIFDLSGVIALVAFGLVIAYYGPGVIDEKSNAFMKELWDLLSYIANTLIFIIIGVIIAEKVSFGWRDVVVLFAVYIGINLVRMVMVSIFYPLMKRSGYGLSRRESLILCWGGLRGALALTLALMVSYTLNIPEDIRRQVLFLTAGIVTLTLIINATTIKWMLSKLGLTDESASKSALSAEMRAQLYERSKGFVEMLRDREALKCAHWDEVEKWLPEPVKAVGAKPKNSDLIADLRLKIVSRERQRYISLYNEGVISVAAQRKLDGMVDFIIDSDGRAHLDERFKLTTMELTTSKQFMRSNRLMRAIWSLRNRDWLITHYDMAVAMIIAEQSVNKFIENLTSAQVIDTKAGESLQSLSMEYCAVVDRAEAYLTEMERSFPITYADAVTIKCRRMLAYFESSQVLEAQSNGVVDNELKEALLEEIRQRCVSSREPSIFKILGLKR